ncbi:MAG: hypothetical protein BAJATHORv1_30167 [Candidatus Thorarchaeota archaeon]|nr:MAG: hypothetical protein BAJATHORv1_30167 [Candidatus Thorarchaeota archaeon]
MVMDLEHDNIVRRDFKHGKIAYGFQWNMSHHKELGNTQGDLASLWAHLLMVKNGEIPEEPFRDPFYGRSSTLKLPKMNTRAKVAFRRKLIRNGVIVKDVSSSLVTFLRDFHIARNDHSFRADHSILQDFLYEDSSALAIEIPVWSDHYKISGHIDLIRFVDDKIQVCDYKPGPLDNVARRFLDSIPQVASYGEMLSHHLAQTLRSALEAPLLPKVECCIFDTHSCWKFNSDLFVTLEMTNNIVGL